MACVGIGGKGVEQVAMHAVMFSSFFRPCLKGAQRWEVGEGGEVCGICMEVPSMQNVLPKWGV